MRLKPISISLPSWVASCMEEGEMYRTDEEKMRFVIGLARKNVLQGTGGPYGAAVFERFNGRPIAVGVNMVERSHNSVLHAEVVALMLAEAHHQSFTLSGPGLPVHELVTSCEPCAMCLGAALWSGAKRIVCGAARADAEKLGFDEGPVFPESYQYLEDRGIEVVRGILADEARGVFDLYRERKGLIYNG